VVAATALPRSPTFLRIRLTLRRSRAAGTHSLSFPLFFTRRACQKKIFFKQQPHKPNCRRSAQDPAPSTSLCPTGYARSRKRLTIFRPSHSDLCHPAMKQVFEAMAFAPENGNFLSQCPFFVSMSAGDLPPNRNFFLLPP